LETIAFDTSDVAEAARRLDTASMIRVSAGDGARGGPSFRWSSGAESSTARGASGIHWEIHDGGMITIAQWDRPDWACASMEQAKRVAEEIDARPKFPRRFRGV
jgi:hypothetical protein